jgi:hypothetical protein
VAVTRKKKPLVEVENEGFWDDTGPCRHLSTTRVLDFILRSTSYRSEKDPDRDGGSIASFTCD